MKVRFLPPARQEFREAVFAYNAERAGLGDEFRDCVWEAIQRIIEFPNAWHPLGGAMRRCRTRRFPYALIYESRDEDVILIAVAHLHRAPTYWRERQQ